MDLERPVTEELVTEQTTVAELIAMAKAEQVVAQNKAKRMKELEAQMKQLQDEYLALSYPSSIMSKSQHSRWQQELTQLVANAICEQVAESKESEDN